MKSLTIILCFVTIASSQQPETCSVTYDYSNSKIRFDMDWVQPVGVSGRPGKRGPIGPPGPKGEKGDEGPTREIPDEILTGYETRIRILEQKLHKLTNLFMHEWKAGSNGYFYLVSENGMNWQQAKTFCEEKEAMLATVGARDQSMFNFLKNLAPGRYLWIGLNDIPTEGTWVWIDGVDSTSLNTIWEPGQPDNSRGNQDCGMYQPLYSTGLDDAGCSFSGSYALCELELK